MSYSKENYFKLWVTKSIGTASSVKLVYFNVCCKSRTTEHQPQTFSVLQFITQSILTLTNTTGKVYSAVEFKVYLKLEVLRNGHI